MKKIEKIATDIADRVISGLTDKSQFQRRIRESDQAREFEGKDALSSLRRLGGKKLCSGEEVILARRLYTEVQVLKQHLRAKGVGIGEFCIDAKLADASESSKELHRLILTPGKNPSAIRLRRTADKYYRLIMAISKTTKESASTLADRVLRGTSLHPAKNLGNLSETELVQTALQGIVDKIDGEFGIFAKYMEVAELKARHIASGGMENWPKWDLPEPDWDGYEQEFADAMNPDFAFWQREKNWPPFEPWCQAPTSGDSGALQDNNFFYVPHAPLGITDCFNLPNRQKDPIAYEKSVQSIILGWRKIDDSTELSWLDRGRTVADQWDEESNKPIGQTLDGNDSMISADYAWIVIYPMPDNSRLMPMLYMHQQEGGAYLVPLDARNLDLFRDTLWLDETRHTSVFDRIKELLGYQPGTPKVIEDGLRRTSPWLNHNPFFKMKQQNADDLQMLDAFCQQLWEKK